MRTTLHATIQRMRLAQADHQADHQANHRANPVDEATQPVSGWSLRHMPRHAFPEEPTPFAQILLEYMDRTRAGQWAPPLTIGQLAIRLNTSRQTIHNWIYKGQTPIIETILTVFSTLNIPLNDLLSRYQAAGIPIPPVYAISPTEAPSSATTDPSATTYATKLRGEQDKPREPRDKRQKRRLPTTAPEPLPYTPQPPRDPAQDASEEWERVIAQTAQSLRDAGMPQATIEGAIAALRARQSGEIPERPATSAMSAASAEPLGSSEPESGSPASPPRGRGQRTDDTTTTQTQDQTRDQTKRTQHA